MEQFKVARWGNSLAVRLPSKLVKQMGLSEGDMLPAEVITGGAALGARLDAEREAKKMTQEEGAAAIRERWKLFPTHLKPEDWKIDRNDPDMRG